jgi:hypothetical protein
MTSGEYLFLIFALVIFIIIWSWGFKYRKSGGEHSEKAS